MPFPLFDIGFDIAFHIGFDIGFDVSDSGALSSLNLASNCLCGIEHGFGTYDASGNAASFFQTPHSLTLDFHV
jgi:hypothetical protein